jgi:ParB family chromosome partitioning protein
MVVAAKKKAAPRKGINGEVAKARKVFEADDKAAAVAGAKVPAVLAVKETPVAIAELYESPDNPRITFDPAALEKLARTFADVGILSPLIVRDSRSPLRQTPAPRDAGYEVLAGARRFRAANLAKLKQAPCKIVEVTDAQAADIMATENLDREDLNPIERARSYKLLIDKSGYTQTALAARFKITQGQVSNCVRILELPEALQSRIGNRQLSIEQGRDLVRLAAFPELIKRVDVELQKELKARGTDSIADWMINRALVEAVKPIGRPMTTSEWHTPHRRFKVDEAKSKELRIVKINHDEWALNTKLWDELQEKAIEAEEKRAKKSASGSKKPSAAERQAKEDKAANQYAKRLYAWRVCWLQERIAERIKSESVSVGECLKLLLFFSVQSPAHCRNDELAESIEAHGLSSGEAGFDDDMETIAAIDTAKLDSIIRGALWLWVRHDASGNSTDLHAEDVEAIAKMLRVDISKEWHLTEDFLELHTREQLLALETEWQLSISGSTMKRKELIGQLLAHGLKVKAPKALVAAKPARHY